MSDLSRFLLVSNGNVTGIVDRLVKERFVTRTKRNGDKRTSVVRLTPDGIATFKAMAEAHEKWVSEMLASISRVEAEALSNILRSFGSDWEGHHD